MSKSVLSGPRYYSMNDVNVIANREANHSETDTATDQKYMSRLLPWEDNIVGTYLGVVCIMALTLNSLVIYTCLKNWKCLLMSDYYILNLACSDVLLPMTAFPLPISSAYFHRWMYSDTGCVVYGFLGFFFGLVSITTLTTMGLTRYVSVCHPGKGSSNLNSTKVAIVFSYIYAFIWSTIPLSGWGSYSSESYGISCTLQWKDNRVFITLMCVFCISTPSAIMFFSYTMILLKCRQSNSNMRSWQSGNSKLTRKEIYLIKITFAMCWGFLICWMPYAIVSLWTAYGNATYLPIRLTVVAVLLAKSSTFVNPVIYFLMNNKFRPLLLRSLQLDSGQQQRKIKETKQLQSLIALRGKRSPGYSTSVSSKSTSSIERLVNHVTNFNFSVNTEDVAL